MAQFSNYQGVRQFYVATALETTNAGLATNGEILPAGDTAKTNFYFKYKSPGGIIRSDLIPVANVTSLKAVAYDNLTRGLKKVKVLLNSDLSTTPVAGQDYVLRINLYALNTPSFEDQYSKSAVVRATTGMTDTQLLAALKVEMDATLSKEVQDLFTLTLTNGVAHVDGVAGTFTGTVAGLTAPVTITANVLGTTGNITLTANSTSTIAELITAHNVAGVDVTLTMGDGTQIPTANIVLAGGVATVAGSAAYLIIEEVEQPWVLGTRSVVPLNFTVSTPSITVSGEEGYWGTVTTETSTTFLGNGKTTADMEYFYMGERGDQYRNIGWPNVVPTTYMAVSTTVYNFIEISYFYAGDAEDVQRSKKQLTIAVPAAGETPFALVNTIINAIESVSGLTLADLS